MFKVFIISTLSFILIHISHFLLFEINVVLYAALFDSFLAFVFSFTYFQLKKILSTVNQLCMIISLLVFIIYSILVPTALDRSLSLYILRYIDVHQEVQVDELPNIVKASYFEKMLVIEQRINEQLTTGTIILKENKIHLTSKGKVIAKFSKFYKEFFLKNLVHK